MVTTYTPTKTAQTDLLIWQDRVSGDYVEGTAFDCSGIIGLGFFTLKIGRLTGTAFTAGSPNIRVEASPASSGEQWVPIYSYQPGVGVATIAATTANGAIAANAGTFVLASGSNIAVGNLLFLGHTTTPANYELITVKSGTTTVTPVHNVINAHDTGCVITNQAEWVGFTIDLSPFFRIRAVVDNLNSGQGFKVELKLSTETNIIGT